MRYVIGARLVEVLLVAVVVVGLATSVLGRVLPAMGHPVYVVAGPSMAPAIGMGAAVILEAVSTADLVVGDVVSLRSGPGRAVYTHRIVRIAEYRGETFFETRGDANAAPDPSLTPASAVIGRVAVAVPVAGYLIALASSVPGVVLVLSLGALLLTIGWVLDGLADEHRRRRTASGDAVARPRPRPVRSRGPA